jgi:uncharacterized membrane protein
MCAYSTYAIKSDATILGGATLPYAVLILGIVTLLLAIFGTIATVCEIRVFLIIYLCIVVIIGFLLFLIGIFIFIEKNNAQTYIIRGWNETPIQGQNALQELFNCCGLTSLPANLTTTPCPTITTMPCLDILKDDFEHYYIQIGALSIVIGLFMIAVGAFVYILTKGIKRKQILENVRKTHKKYREEKSDPTDALELIKHKSGIGNTTRLHKVAVRDMEDEVLDEEVPNTKSKNPPKNRIESDSEEGYDDEDVQVERSDEDFGDESEEEKHPRGRSNRY